MAKLIYFNMLDRDPCAQITKFTHANKHPRALCTNKTLHRKTTTAKGSEERPSSVFDGAVREPRTQHESVHREPPPAHNEKVEHNHANVEKEEGVHVVADQDKLAID